MSWYVLQVMTGEELDVRRRVESLGFKSLAPREEIFERRQGKNYKRLRILFSSYVFVHIDYDSNKYHRLRNLPGVLRFLGSPGPQPVPDEEMKPILHFCSDGELIGITTALKDGDRVRIIDGPLKNFDGKIIKVDRRKGRARVMVTLFGKEHFIDFGVEILEESQIQDNLIPCNPDCALLGNDKLPEDLNKCRLSNCCLTDWNVN